MYELALLDIPYAERPVARTRDGNGPALEDFEASDRGGVAAECVLADTSRVRAGVSGED